MRFIANPIHHHDLVARPLFTKKIYESNPGGVYGVFPYRRLADAVGIRGEWVAPYKEKKKFQQKSFGERRWCDYRGSSSANLVSTFSQPDRIRR
jgi:hypothetical protein